MPATHHSVFTGQMPFLPPDQQHQSTEGTLSEMFWNYSISAIDSAYPVYTPDAEDRQAFRKFCYNAQQ